MTASPATQGTPVTAEMVKALREQTEAGIMDCRRALSDAGGDMDKAKSILREKGMASAGKKSGRETKQGLVESYIHGGRIGALVGPATLVYAKAGYTNARYNLTYTEPTGVSNFKLHDNLDGVRVGAGVEQAVGRNAYVKAEYRYSNYEQGFDRHQVVAGFGFRF